MPTTVNGNKVSVASAQGDIKRQAATDAGAYPLQGITLAQALAFLTANVSDLPTAKVYMGHATRKIFQLQAAVDELTAIVASIKRGS